MKSSQNHLTRRPLPLGLRIIATGLLPILTFTSVPVPVWTEVDISSPSATPANQSAQPKPPKQQPRPAPKVKVKYTAPQTAPPPAAPVFSDPPVDTDFLHSHVLPEPLVPIGGTTSIEEDTALAAALISFAKSGDAENTAPLTGFLNQYPDSAWKASLLTNLGILYRHTGYWTKALAAFETAWQLSKGATGQPATGIADAAVGELSELNARLGRFNRLEKLVSELDDRPMHGSGAAKVDASKRGLWLMMNQPGRVFRCGPMALTSIWMAQHPGAGGNQRIFDANSTHKGFSLDQLNTLAGDVGMKFQMAKRDAGAQVVVPAVVNWKVGHYAAIMKVENGKYLIQDPTFSSNFWISQQALEEESSGYFLVPAGKLAQGWHKVASNEGKTIWGKGPVNGTPPPPPPCTAPKTKCDGGGCSDKPSPMATYDVDPSRINLELNDTPVGYEPPIGPPVRFRVSYSQQDVAAPSVPTFANLGPQWGCNWIGYIIDDPNNVSTSSYGPGGGTLTYAGYNGPSTSGTFGMQQESHQVLVKTGTSSYEQRFPDGSRRIYNISDHGSPQKIFMSQWIDSTGNGLTFTYDSHYRLSAITDAIGQVTTISYVSDDSTNSGFYLISQVTDPFQRSASFTYNAAGQLASITDIIGITSSFTYGTNDFVSSLTTPYGTTTFVPGGSGVDLSLKIIDPQGGTEFLQYDTSTSPSDISSPVPPQNLIGTAQQYEMYRNTYYWSKLAYAQAPGDKTKAKLMHWLHVNSNGNTTSTGSDVLESEKPATESRIFYNYAGQPNVYTEGTSNQPVKVARVLDDGTTQLYQYEYNSLGKVTKTVDPLGRTTTYKYDANNIDLLAVYQQNPAGASTDSYGQAADLLTSYTYNSQHLPLTVTDASGQTTTYTYYASGRIHTVTNAKNETTTFAYDANGYLQSVIGAMPGSVMTFAYDGFGRVRTVTDTEGYAVTTDYDSADRTVQKTYPDGTTDQITYNRLDVEWTQDRLGRKTHMFHDALRHTVLVEDPLHRMTQYEWCSCGSLEAIIDPAGSRTSWDRDVDGRVVLKTFNDGTTVTSKYENNAGRLKSVTDIIGQTVNYTFNKDNTMAQVSYTNAQNATPGVSYTYETVYNRIAGMVDVTGTTSYGYNVIPVVPAAGAGRLATVTGPLSNSTMAYGYDELGRVVNRSINGAANTEANTFDVLGRVSAVTNMLGTFNYSYIDNTGRLSATNYPNRQTVNFSYYGNIGDHQMQEIKNLDPSSNMQSQFDYTYDAVGEIASWQQNNSGLAEAKTYGLNYDDANQLAGATVTASGSSAPSASYAYGYDKAGNRTQEQTGSATTTSTYNGLNQLTSQSAGGLTHFSGKLSEWANVTVGGSAAAVSSVVTTSGTSFSFDGAANLASGTNTVPIVATDASGNTKTKNYQVVVPEGSGKTLTYDLLGNLTSDGTRNYVWDAANRLIKIWYGTVGSAASSSFVYDGLGRRVQILEKDASGMVTDTKNFVWHVGTVEPSEERDVSNNVTKRFYTQGEQIFGESYFYALDHAGSVREMTDSSGSIRVRYDYDLWGRLTKVAGDLDSDFTYAGYFNHKPSGLYFTLFRQFSAELGRWLSRDPLKDAESSEGPNLYRYVNNNPVSYYDPTGLDTCPDFGNLNQKGFDSECWMCTNWMVDSDSIYTTSQRDFDNYTVNKKLIMSTVIEIPMEGLIVPISAEQYFVHEEWDVIDVIFRKSRYYRVCVYKPSNTPISDSATTTEVLDRFIRHKTKNSYQTILEPELLPMRLEIKGKL